MKKFIDNKEHHNKILFELGLLDDDDDYELYCKMQVDGIDLDTYLKYLTVDEDKRKFK